MKKITLGGSCVLAALLAGHVAHADVTPAEIWQEWQDIITSYGQVLTTESVEDGGNRLVVRGLSVESSQPDVAAVATIEEVVFQDQGDGTVRITMSETYPVTITVTAPDEAPTTVSLTVTNEGLEMIAGGDALETSYDFTASALAVVLDGIEGPGAEGGDVAAEFTFSGVTGTYLSTGTGVKQVSGTFAAEQLEMALAGSEEEGDTDFVFGLSLADVEGISAGSILEMVDMADMAAALNAGFSSEAEVTYGAGSFEMEATDQGSGTVASGTLEGGGFSVAVSRDGIAYSGEGTGVSVTFSGDEIPFPEVTLSYAEAGFDLLIPVSQDAEPQDFRFATRLVGLTLPDELWDMVDPMGSIDREPATLVLDTTGTAVLSVDLLDPASTEALGEAAPGELRSLDIAELELSLGGAELTGSGAFAFDNSDMETFEGVPAPTGQLDLRLVGGNALLDTLVQMGLIPQDQAMGARMMMGLFARPGTGEDTLTSTLEFRDGGFYANGQRLQ